MSGTSVCEYGVVVGVWDPFVYLLSYNGLSLGLCFAVVVVFVSV